MQHVEIGVVWVVRGHQGHWQHSHSIQHIQLPVDFDRNYASILYPFRVIASYLSQVADFNPIHLPPFGDPVRILPRSLAQKTRVLAIVWPCFVILSVAVLIQYRRVRDRHTHAHTDTQQRHIGLPR